MALRPYLDQIIKNFETRFKTFNHIEISRTNLLHNYDYFQKLNPNTQIWPVLKSNAYGHGLKQVASVLKERQFDYFIVDSFHEALKIWETTHRKVLLIAPVHPDNYSQLKFKNLTLTIQDTFSLKRIAQIKKPVRIHLKINTGMSRQGIDTDEIPKILKILHQNKQINLEGLCSHLADADNTDNSFSLKQQDKFLSAINTIKQNGFNPKFIHLSATASAAKINHPHLNAIRLGIGLYGFNPLKPSDKYFDKLRQLKPALSFKSSIEKIRAISKNDCISYNCTYISDKKRNVAIIPVGYFEGLDRRLSNRGFVKYQNKFYPIIGQICMNMSIIDFGRVAPKLFDEVEVVSPLAQDKNSIQSHSRLCQTIPYELLVHLNESVRRIVV